MDETGDIVIEGFLRKMKEGKKPAQRWCKLIIGEAGPRLAYRKAQKDKTARGVLALHGAWVGLGTPTAFDVLPCPQLNSVKRSKRFFFDCSSAETRTRSARFVRVIFYPKL